MRCRPGSLCSRSAARSSLPPSRVRRRVWPGPKPSRWRPSASSPASRPSSPREWSPAPSSTRPRPAIAPPAPRWMPPRRPSPRPARPMVIPASWRPTPGSSPSGWWSWGRRSPRARRCSRASPWASCEWSWSCPSPPSLWPVNLWMCRYCYRMARPLRPSSWPASTTPTTRATPFACASICRQKPPGYCPACGSRCSSSEVSARCCSSRSPPCCAKGSSMASTSGRERAGP